MDIMKREPAVLIGFVASAIVALLALFHVVIDVNTVTGVITALIPLIAAFVTRSQVTPATPGATTVNRVAAE